MIPIPKKTNWHGEARSIDGAMERLLKDNPLVPPQGQPSPPGQSPDPDLNGFIYVPSTKLYFAKEITLQGKNWRDTHKSLIQQGLEMPTPAETWSLISYLETNLNNPDFRTVYDDILKITPQKTWHGEWQNAYFSNKGSDMEKYMQKVTGLDSNGELVFSNPSRLVGYLPKDCWARLGTNGDVSSAGLCTVEDSAPYSQGKNIYFWYPRDGAVAGFGANSDRANLNCNRDPDNSNSSLGIAKVAPRHNIYMEVLT